MSELAERPAPVAYRPYFWERLIDADGKWSKAPVNGANGADLAALRRGLGREPGSVPQMWRYYTTLRKDGAATAWLWAEHVALGLFAVHQQSEPRPMHKPGIGFGSAMAALRDSDKFSDIAVDRRFSTAATADTLNEAVVHLRGLVGQLRTVHQPLDYSWLVRDLAGWEDPDKLSRMRRRWGGQYFTGRKDDDEAAPDSQ